MDTLTNRQREALDFLQEYLKDNGFPPTLREISAHMKITGTLSATRHLEALEKKGYIKRQAKGSRGIALIPQIQGEAVPEPVGFLDCFGECLSAVFLPVVGMVRAGMPHPAIEDIIDYHPMADAVARKTGATFCLKVKGDSMINAGVFEGDLALIRPQPTAANRDMVVAMVDCEATLKWFHHEGDRIRLQPANPNYEPIYAFPGQDVTIVGKVVGLYRDMGK
jgi:repressor LexA